MKLKRKSKVNLWFDESRKQRVSAEEWLKTEEGQEWLQQWRAYREQRQAEVQRMVSETVSMTGVLKQIYPDNAAPAPLGGKP